MDNLKLKTSVVSVQWLVFLIANSLTLPIIIGQVFHLPAAEISSLMQRTFLVVGLSSLLSGWLGHRLPIPDCPAGIWLGVFIIMGQIATFQGTSHSLTLQLLEGGMLIAGLVLTIIGLSGWMGKMLKLFTPLVNGVFLMTLTFSLSGTFLKGMIGVSSPSSHVQTGNVVVGFAVFILVLALSIWGKGWLKSYAVLIGVAVGWVFFGIINGFGSTPQYSSMILFPKMFAWGMPRLNSGMFISSVLIAFVLISNIIASVSAMLQVFTETGANSRQSDRQSMTVENRFKRSGIIGGVSSVLSSVFSTVGGVPFSISAGFVRMTGESSLAPFLIACIALMVISLFPGVYSRLAMMPGPVAYAAMFASFTQMVGLGINSIVRQPLDQRRLAILGISLTMGAAVMYLPQSVFASMPTVLQYIFSNGVMVGLLLAMVLEQIWRVEESKTLIGN